MRDPRDIAFGVLIVVLLILGCLFAATVEKQEDCGMWRYTKQGPLMCEDWP